jgi:hypothetical protein
MKILIFFYLKTTQIIMIMSNVFAHDDTVCSSPLLLALPWMATPPAVIELAVALSSVDRTVRLRKRKTAVNCSRKMHKK